MVWPTLAPLMVSRMAQRGMTTPFRRMAIPGMVACTATNQPRENLSKCSRKAPKGMLVAAATKAMEAILMCSACMPGNTSVNMGVFARDQVTVQVGLQDCLNLNPSSRGASLPEVGKWITCQPEFEAQLAAFSLVQIHPYGCSHSHRRMD